MRQVKAYPKAKISLFRHCPQSYPQILWIKKKSLSKPPLSPAMAVLAGLHVAPHDVLSVLRKRLQPPNSLDFGAEIGPNKRVMHSAAELARNFPARAWIFQVIDFKGKLF